MDRRGFILSGAAVIAVAALPFPSKQFGPEPGQITPCRTAMVKRGDEWHLRMFKDLRKGDVFKLYESDGELVMHGTPYETAIATSNPEKQQIDNGWTWGIKADTWVDNR